MNEERTGKCLRQVEHIRSHLWHRYSITVSQVMVATVNFLSDDFNLTKRNPWFGSFLVSSSPLSRKSTERNLLHRQVLLKCCHVSKFTMGKLKSFFCCKVSFLTDPHCQFRGVGQSMKQTYLYLWYPSFQAQWDRYDQRNHQTYNYLVKGHHIYSETWN